MNNKNIFFLFSVIPPIIMLVGLFIFKAFFPHCELNTFGYCGFNPNDYSGSASKLWVKLNYVLMFLIYVMLFLKTKKLFLGFLFGAIGVFTLIFLYLLLGWAVFYSVSPFWIILVILIIIFPALWFATLVSGIVLGFAKYVLKKQIE